MTSYTNSNYSNDFFDLTGVYFNSTSQKNSNINIDELDIRYLQKTGGTISNNLLINGSLDIQTSLTLPSGNIATLIESKQDIINDESLSISKTLNLQSSLNTLQDNIDTKQNIINDDDLTISKTLNLESSLNTLQDNIDLNTTNILTKQNTITEGSLSIDKTNGLQTALNSKQATITTSTSLSANILTAKNIISQNTTSTGELTVEGQGLNFDAYLDIKNIKRAQVLTTLDGGWYRIRSGGGSANNGILSFEKLSPVDGSLLTTPLSILNNGDIVAQKNLYIGQNTNDATTKSIFFGGTLNDNSFLHTVIENRIYEVDTEKSELLLFKGNDIETAADRIRLRGANIVFDTYPTPSSIRTDENIRMTILSNGNVGIGRTTPTALLDVNGDVLIEGDLTVENIIVGSTNLISEINTKQNIINDDDLTISKILNLQSSLTNLQDDIDLNTTNISNKQDLIDISITLEGFNISENINFFNSTNTDYEYLDYNFLNTLRLRNETFGSTLTANNIILSGDLTAENLIVGSTNLISALNTKQDTITDGSLTIARTNGLQTTLNAKQATITNNSLTIARTNGLQTALDSTAKIASANVFTTSQEITGNLKATLVQVSTTTPALDTHLTSKFYVDKQDNLSAKLASANDFIGNQKITGNLNVGGTFTLNGGDVNTTLASILSRLDALEA